MLQSSPLRSVLFVPGNRARMLEKARSLPADALILDLEDGVPAGEKIAARAVLRQALAGSPYGPQVILRVNGLATGLTEGDLQETLVDGIQAVCLPKAETAADVTRLAALLDEMEGRPGRPRGPLALFLMIETAMGVLSALAMVQASRRVRALCLGGEDLAHELGAVRTHTGIEIALARAQLVLAARAGGAVAVDTIFTDLADLDGLLAEARTARQMGYSGKLIIHPHQIAPVHRAFTPSDHEIAYARRVLEAFEAAEARGQGVVALDGKMIDAPVVARAREILAYMEESES